ncbi:MGDG synthase family glycosyltransferase [Streptomyces qinglanensis]|uniref:UDP-N-acetylglucosamine:LPS N-acetylglucosamine transferase n=1 Tax=Streptomyces qinglanensis TaxID=943816 RepID=A0A1H9TC63_9ACTN|nr:galactosyldiacylglycerol synthase [Streptomyces qinglanensis]SER94751.1 UDP-N-acetylglucosamine:LPS N-acetylglucosamine transferase [Streptomyces qinglanensis]
MPHRFLLLSASMGAGHDAVAHELAHRLRARGHPAVVRDILGMLPAGSGRVLRTGYRGTVRHAPKLYGAVYASFLATAAAPGPRPSSAPLAALAERPLLRAVAEWRPDVVVPTFHLSAQVTGRLRARGALEVPAAVVVVDFAVHRGWLHPGNDLHLCVTEAAAAQVRSALGGPARNTGPVVPARFFRPRDSDGRWRALLDRHVAAAAQHTRPLSTERPAVLMSTGAWGVGTRLMETARHLADHGCVPVLLCGNDTRLRHRATRHPGLLPLGWVTDLPGLMAATHVLLDNAAGQTAAQALAAGLPVVGHRPLPGHAEAGVRAMAQAGLSRYAAGAAEPAHSAHELAFPGPARARLAAAARAAFHGDPVDELLGLAGRADTADSRTA